MPTPSLLALPPELREQIYSLILRDEYNLYAKPEPTTSKSGIRFYYKFDLAILAVNKLIHREASKVFKDNHFVKIRTPFVDILHQINYTVRKVARIVESPQADRFNGYHLQVMINGSESIEWSDADFSIITCAHQLDKFAKLWCFTDLENLGQLNPNLSLRLDLKNPHDSSQSLPEELQKSLIMPFEQVKNLNAMTFDVHGKPMFGVFVHDQIRRSLLASQKVPAPTPEECITACIVQQTHGDEAMQAALYRKALAYYIDAFATIHIMYNGHQEEVLCDNYYRKILISGPYAGQEGDYARTSLRVQLVAKVILAYLKLDQDDEAYFWGRRTVQRIRESTTGNDRSIGGPEWHSWIITISNIEIDYKAQVGEIFFRTALAAKCIAHNEPMNACHGEVKPLLLAANAFLPDDPLVAAELHHWDVTDLEIEV